MKKKPAKKRGKSFNERLATVAVRPRVRYDDHCPCCGTDIGGPGAYDLEELFDGQRLIAGKSLTRKIVCSFCDEPLQVTLDVSFALKEIPCRSTTTKRT